MLLKIADERRGKGVQSWPCAVNLPENMSCEILEWPVRPDGLYD